jgi:hypothetical protein
MLMEKIVDNLLGGTCLLVMIPEPLETLFVGLLATQPRRKVPELDAIANNQCKKGLESFFPASLHQGNFS